MTTTAQDLVRWMAQRPHSPASKTISSILAKQTPRHRLRPEDLANLARAFHEQAEGINTLISKTVTVDGPEFPGHSVVSMMYAMSMLEKDFNLSADPTGKSVKNSVALLVNNERIEVTAHSKRITLRPLPVSFRAENLEFLYFRQTAHHLSYRTDEMATVVGLSLLMLQQSHIVQAGQALPGSIPLIMPLYDRMLIGRMQESALDSRLRQCVISKGKPVNIPIAKDCLDSEISYLTLRDPGSISVSEAAICEQLRNRFFTERARATLAHLLDDYSRGETTPQPRNPRFADYQELADALNEITSSLLWLQATGQMVTASPVLHLGAQPNR